MIASLLSASPRFVYQELLSNLAHKDKLVFSFLFCLHTARHKEQLCTHAELQFLISDLSPHELVASKTRTCAQAQNDQTQKDQETKS